MAQLVTARRSPGHWRTRADQPVQMASLNPNCNTSGYVDPATMLDKRTAKKKQLALEAQGRREAKRQTRHRNR